MLNRSSPVQVGTYTDWKEVKAGTNHTVAIKTNGTIWVWGYNTSFGNLGLGAGGASISSPVQVGTLADWKQVAIGEAHTAALRF